MISVTPLTAKNFAPFGQVIETRGRDGQWINQGQTLRFGDLANIDVLKENGQPRISIFQTTPLALPIRLQMMERHQLGSQAFIPLSDRNWLLVVAPPGAFDRTQIQAFAANGDQGVNFHPGTWHHFSLALDQVSDFLVIDRGAVLDDYDEIKLDPPLQIGPLS